MSCGGPPSSCSVARESSLQSKTMLCLRPVTRVPGIVLLVGERFKAFQLLEKRLSAAADATSKVHRRRERAESHVSLTHSLPTHTRNARRPFPHTSMGNPIFFVGFTKFPRFATHHPADTTPIGTPIRQKRRRTSGNTSGRSIQDAASELP